MQIDPLLEWQRLTQLYREKCDEELLELDADRADLTEIAQQVLGNEIRNRGLRAQRAAESAPARPRDSFAPGYDRESVDSEPEEDQEDDQPREFTWKTLLCECEDYEKARPIYEVLKNAGIDCWIEGLRSSNPRIVVAADQLEQAQAFVAQPIPPAILEESQIEVPDFEAPKCPKCGAADPVLEKVDPANQWRCESCGSQWTDPVEAPKTA